MSSDDLIIVEVEKETTEEVAETNDFIETEEPAEPVEEKKEESEGMKAFKKGAGAVGGFFKKGWGAVKSGAQKANEKFKETEFGKKTVAEMDKFKQTEFAQKVAEGAKKTGAAVKEGAKKTSAAMKEGAQKVKESEFGQKVAEGAKKTGAAVKEGAKKTGAAMKEGAQKVKEASAPALEKAKENMVKLGKDIKASMDSKPTSAGTSSNLPEEP